MLKIAAGKDSFKIFAPERFVFTSHKDFREALQLAVDEAPGVVEIDFTYCTYIDSSALGMLLLARDRLTKGIRLVNVRGVVIQVFQIANFHKLFEIT